MDLPSSHDIPGAQQPLPKGSIRQLHCHRVYDVATVRVGAIWYFPEGVPHTIQGLDGEYEYPLVGNGNFESMGLTAYLRKTAFHVDEQTTHTPKSILAKNFGLPEEVFAWVPSPNPYITNGAADDGTHRSVAGGNGPLTGNASFVYHARDRSLGDVPHGGGTAVFPDYGGGIPYPPVFANMSEEDEDLIQIAISKGDRVKDIPSAQWLALRPADVVANLLRIPVEVAENLKTEKQIPR
ncbi:hypothetical protein DL764_006411 [Monosporascus ibericus]|uniref:Cupin type-1 domain-containing protein n=1 Tax=Monosporascus ibericus TaxID=155417 RepID=A0A4Q4T4X2_9PEZI|nr:hypothetical protein DL764_006411 [Monosporascus ibericus]